MSASKKDQLVENALKTFYCGGFNAIGMDKIASESGVSKTAIYKHFRTKDELILATLELRDKNFRTWLMARIDALGATPKGKLFAIFDALHEWFKEPEFSGCMFVKASSEFMNHSDPIYMASAAHKQTLLIYFTELAKDAEVKNPKSLAEQLLVLKEGAIVMAHLDGPDQIAKVSKTAAKTIIEAHF
jgi:AcrR family transcriptional regulator